MTRCRRSMQAMHRGSHGRAFASGIRASSPAFRSRRRKNSILRPPAYHKLVHVHPGSGRKALYLAAHASHIVGWPIELGRGLIKNLMSFATQPQFVYRHVWKLGDLLMWDNLSHHASRHRFRGHQYRRDMRRATCRERPVDLSVAA